MNPEKIDSKAYSKVWLAFVNINALDDTDFNSLINIDEDTQVYIGAWANILLQAETIEIALNILTAGLKELGFGIRRISKIENLEDLVEQSALKDDILFEADWLLSSEFVFLISDAIFPYAEE
jgi:hypothetical protein